MLRTTFGQPRPKGMDEIKECLEDSPYPHPDDVNASIAYDDTEGSIVFGWSAEVFDNVDGDEVLQTAGYANKEDLLADLRAAGITDIADHD